MITPQLIRRRPKMPGKLCDTPDIGIDRSGRVVTDL